MILIAPVGLMDRGSLPFVVKIHSTLGCFGHCLQWFIERCCVSCMQQYLLDSFQHSRWLDHVEEDIVQDGFVRGYWNTLKHFPFCDMKDAYMKVNSVSDAEVLVLWGRTTESCPSRGARKSSDSSPALI